MQGLEHEVSRLQDACAASLQREMAFRVRIAELEAELENLREQVAQEGEARQVESAGYAFGPGSKDARAARELLQEVIREVNACISLLRS